MSIKVILFDLGNVIVFVNHMDICERIALSGGCALDIYQYIFVEGREVEFDKGLVSPFDFFTRLKENFNLDIDFKSFVKIWSSGFTPNKEIFPLIKTLKQIYHLCLLSNTNQTHFDMIQRDMSILKEFKTFFLSFQMGICKPDPSIFQLVLNSLDIMPNECAYIDDTKKFVESARKLGINGIVFKNVSILKEELINLGINFYDQKIL
jgi:putative hydrolase of the HAD superfamily